jgi:hypothetical protein
MKAPEAVEFPRLYESIAHKAAMIDRKAGGKKMGQAALDPAQPASHVHSIASRPTA